MLRYVLEPGTEQRPAVQEPVATDSPAAALSALRATTIGANHQVHTAFGERRIVYADYTASGRASTIVENFIKEQVLPLYGNTHTLTTATARQSTYLRAEAREVIRHYLNASHEDAVIFTGNGSTAAANLLVQTLQRANFAVHSASNVSTAGVEGNNSCRDMHYREDRWGGGECTLCGVRVKSSTIYLAHKHSEAHRARLRGAEQGGTGCDPGASWQPRRRVVVLADPLLHHSSSLPFRELAPRHPLTGVPAALGEFVGSVWHEAVRNHDHEAAGSLSEAEVELSNLPINETTGLLDEVELRRRLETLRGWSGGTDVGCSRELVVICVLAAASNVTGLCADVPRVTALAHTTLPGVLVFWDFAAFAGHRPCDVNPPGDAAASVDAAFFSPHKLWGGPGSVGLLAVKKRLLCNAVPAVPGGGVVFFVSSDGHSYIQNSEEREEAGTPNIIGCIRAGLVYHLLSQIPAAAVQSHEEAMLKRLLKAWSRHPKIDILGPAAAMAPVGGPTPRTGVISFMVRYGNDSPGLYLHYNFVAAVLNDLFGIQARGGCACAGPYGQWLLGIGPELAKDFESCLARTAQEVLRPGFVRVGVHWAMSEEDQEILEAAVLWVADHGWQLLAAYTFDRETGEWLHRLDTPERHRVWLSNLRLPVKDVSVKESAVPNAMGPIAMLEAALGLGTAAADAPSAHVPRSTGELLSAADAALGGAYGSGQVALSLSKWPMLDPNYAHLLWFALPADAAFSLRSSHTERPQLLTGPGIFAASIAEASTGQRPIHSVLDARPAQGKSEPAAAEDAEGSLGEALDAELQLLFQQLDVEEDGRADVWVKTAGFAQRTLRPSIPKQLRGLVGRAISDFSMIREGDKLLVGLSGGKDSLTVLHVLLALQKSAPIRFEVAAATVDPQTPEYNPSPLIPYMKAIGVKYHMLRKPLIEMAKTCIDPKRPSICAFCSRMKRGMLYSCMREEGYTVLVLGQHLDDFAESFFMSAIHNGLLRTMKANYWVEQEDVRVCRPLLYVREGMTTQFAKENQLPVISDNCPACFAAPKERHKTKVLLSSLEFDYPAIFPILLRTMRPLFSLGTAKRSELLALAVAEEDDEAAKGRTSSGVAGLGADVSHMPDGADEDLMAEGALTACGAQGGHTCQLPTLKSCCLLGSDEPRVA